MKIPLVVCQKFLHVACMSNATTTARQFKILGICDNVNACDCCGKQGLQKTVAIENCETGAIGYFGTSCAMQPSKCFGFEKKEMTFALNSFKTAQQTLWGKARRIYKERGGKYLPIMEFSNVFKVMTQVGIEFADRPLFDSICKELGGASAFLR